MPLSSLRLSTRSRQLTTGSNASHRSHTSWRSPPLGNAIGRSTKNGGLSTFGGRESEGAAAGGRWNRAIGLVDEWDDVPDDVLLEVARYRSPPTARSPSSTSHPAWQRSSVGPP